MKRVYKISAFVIVIAITAVTLTSGIASYDSRTGGYKDLVDELYDQAAKQNDNLGSIEDDIAKFYKKKDEALEKYNSFTSYNNRYYTDAKAKAGLIADAAAKQKANDIINKSETDYKIKLTDWQASIAILNARERELKDLHGLLQIIITEPMIAKYQGSNLPDNSKLKEANSDLKSVIEKIKAIIN